MDEEVFTAESPDAVTPSAESLVRFFLRKPPKCGMRGSGGDVGWLGWKALGLTRLWTIVKDSRGQWHGRMEYLQLPNVDFGDTEEQACDRDIVRLISCFLGARGKTC